MNHLDLDYRLDKDERITLADVEQAWSFADRVSELYHSMICNDRSCYRCKVSDIAFHFEREWVKKNGPYPGRDDE